MSNNLYENQYIGVFLYSLGYFACQNDLTLDTVSMMQQTPLDTTYGDLLTSWQGRNFIFEFKRSEDEVCEEFTKPAKLKLLQNLASNDELRLLADKGHLICYPSIIQYSTQFVNHQYSKIKNDKSQSGTMRFTYNEFVIQYLLNPRNGLNLEELSTYTEFMQACSGKEGAKVSGMLINVDHEGLMHFIQFDNIIELISEYEKAKENKLITLNKALKR